MINYVGANPPTDLLFETQKTHTKKITRNQNPETNTHKKEGSTHFGTYKDVKQDQDSKWNEKGDITLVQSRAIIGEYDGVIGETHDGKDQQYHDRAQAA